MALSPMNDRVTVCTGHLEDTGSLSYAEISEVGTLHHTVSRKS